METRLHRRHVGAFSLTATPPKYGPAGTEDGMIRPGWLASLQRVNPEDVP